MTAAAFVLRLAYLLHSHPFIDEFTTVLAARAILQRGLPVLPSGLFYEHGLLFSYLDAPFVALTGEQVSFAVVRLPSLLIGTATVPLLYWVGRRWLSPQAGLIAAGLLAFSPEGMVWGGRARMYALAQCLVLLLTFLVYEGSRGKGGSRLQNSPAHGLALVVLLATLLSQLAALILVPPLIVGALAVGWLTRPEGGRPWFLRRLALVKAAGLTVVVGLGVLIKRLGQPLGAAPLGGEGAGDLMGELIGTITYQAGLVLDGETAVKFLARQFGVPHHVWLTLIAVVGGLLLLGDWLTARRSENQELRESASRGIREAVGSRSLISSPLSSTSLFYLWLVFGLSVLEMVVLLEPWRRNPRYLVMALPLFYLIVAGSLARISNLRSVNHISQISVFIFIIVQAGLLVPDLRIAYRTPEPAYEEAFEYVADQWQAGDVLLTMNTSAAGLFLGQAEAELYRFAVQEYARQFLLDADTHPVDRWLGVPWIGTANDFSRALNQHRRAWFVVDTIRLPVLYRGDWLAILDSQMDLVWSHDNALVYLTRPDRAPLPAYPDVSLDARFGDMIALDGYSIAREVDYTAEEQAGPCKAGQVLCLKPGDRLRVTFFWRALATVDANYTIFLHVRNEQGITVAQRDSQPFDGLYPTSQWRLGETVAQPLDVDLPLDLAVGRYSLYVGLYRLDTMTRLSLDQDASGEDAFILGEGIRVISGER